MGHSTKVSSKICAKHLLPEYYYVPSFLHNDLVRDHHYLVSSLFVFKRQSSAPKSPEKFNILVVIKFLFVNNVGHQLPLWHRDVI